jgi:putative membrane protein
MGMGAANVIPGVSGGTIALITGIFQRLIDSLKSFDLKALRLLLKGKYQELFQHTDVYFLFSVFLGIGISILSLAKLLGWLFLNYPILIWSYFFGLILASVYFVGRTITQWNVPAIMAFIAGTAIAATISIISPATPNDSFFYLILCGVAAICSMILPGISGSFVLLLMGNYELVINAVAELNIRILLPVAIGSAVGLIAFTHFLSWVFKKFRNQTIATLTGFILGSLMILWPWKNALYMLDASGKAIIRNGKKIIEGYDMFIPALNTETLWALCIMIAGILTIWIIEKTAGEK